jgi:uncharacterized membrane protein (UPF0182 family)
MIRIPERRSRRRGIIIALLIVVALLLLASARFYTDVLWFQEVGLTAVLFKSIYTQFFVGLAVGVLVAAVVWVNLIIAGRTAPPYRMPVVEGDRRNEAIERYVEMVGPYLKWLRLAAAIVVGIIAGVGASAAWQHFLLWSNRVPFGERDPQFNRDIGFYVFELPFLKDITDYLWFAFLAALLLSVAAHYLQGSIRPEIGLRGLSPAVLAHVSVLLGCLALVKAVQYYLGTFELNFSPRGTVTGASYTDVNAQLPALRLLAIISIISALLFIVNIRFRRLALPIAAVGIWIFTAVLAGGLWPAAIQRFTVQPQELQRELPYIERNLEATRTAFGVSDVEDVDFLASPDLTEEEIQGNEPLLQNVRLWDPAMLQRAYAQLQAIRTYYEFQDVDIDRYEIDGEMRQVLLSARELSLDDLPEGSRTWPNQHLQYTHGYGIVASLANDLTEAGQPDFLVKDIPGTVEEGADSLDPEDQPRLYFGESFEANEYSIVRSKQEEIDFETETGEVERSRYDGVGGIPLGNIFRRLAFAVREFDSNLMISNLVQSDSRIMLYRNVRDRVSRAAPFLSLDNDPYPAVVDGRTVWILDAYTSTQWYPYSQRFPFQDIVAPGQGTLTGDQNYIRNSVKIVVDAFNGTMDFYIVDDEDPLIAAWDKAFPDLFSDEEPSDSLREHFRYPEDLFKLQSEVYLSYHIEGPENFYSKSDVWAIPQSGGDSGSELLAPTYLLFSLPDEPEQEFVLTRPFTPRARNNMTSFMVARSDPEHYGEIVTLQFPRSRQILGPVQVDNLINQDFEISQDLSLLRQGGSDVSFGSLVILPVEDSVMYVRPLFVIANGTQGGTTTTTAQTSSGIPEVKRVILVFGEEVVMEETFDLALASLFDLEEQPEITDQLPGEDQPPGEDGEGDDGGEEPPPGEQRELDQIVEEASRLYDRAQQALQDGDFEAYGRLINELGALLEEAQALSDGG